MNASQRRLAFAIDSLGSGGAQRQVVELAVALKRRGRFAPQVFVYHDDDFFTPRLASAGVPLIRIPRRGRLDPRFPLQFSRALRDREIELVHAFLLIPAFWSLLATLSLGSHRPRLIAAERDSQIASSPREWMLQRLVYRSSDAVTANASPVAAEIVTRLGVARDRVIYLPNGIDLDDWDSAARADCPLKLDPARFNFALVGGLRPQKNHALLFRALALVPAEIRERWNVWCVGGATAGAAAARRVSEDLRAAGLEEIVRLVPPLANVAALFARLDAVVLVSRREGFPNVLLEAQASRVPVVSTRVGDVAALVEDGASGLLVDSVPEKIAAALTQIARMPVEDRRSMGQRGRAIVAERFTMDHIARLHEEVYARVLDQCP